MRIGIGSYAYTWSIGVSGQEPAHPMSVHTFLDRAYDLGAECVQLADNFPLEKYSHSTLKKIKEHALRLEMPVEIGMRGVIPEQLGHFLRMAHFFQSPILRVILDAPGFIPSVEEVCTIIRSHLSALRSLRVKLAIENHDRLTARAFRKIVMQTDPEWVGICLDSVNSFGCGECFAETSEILLPHTINLHVKDFQIRRVSHHMGFEVTGTPAGQGMLPIPSLLERLEKLGRCQSAILELWPAPEEDIAATVQKEDRWVRESMEYLRTLADHQ